MWIVCPACCAVTAPVFEASALLGVFSGDADTKVCIYCGAALEVTITVKRASESPE